MRLVVVSKPPTKVMMQLAMISSFREAIAFEFRFHERVHEAWAGLLPLILNCFPEKLGQVFDGIEHAWDAIGVVLKLPSISANWPTRFLAAAQIQWGLRKVLK